MARKTDIANRYKQQMASVDLSASDRTHNALVAEETGIAVEQISGIRAGQVKVFSREEAKRLDGFFNTRIDALKRPSLSRTFEDFFPEGVTELTFERQAKIVDPSEGERKSPRPTAHSGNKREYRYTFSSNGISEEAFREALKTLLNEKMIDAGFFNKTRGVIRFSDFGAAAGLDSERIRKIARGGNVFTESEIVRLDQFFAENGQSAELKQRTFAGLFESNQVPPIKDDNFYGQEINKRNQLARHTR